MTVSINPSFASLHNRCALWWFTTHTFELKVNSLMPFLMLTLLHFWRYVDISYDVGLNSYYFIIYLHDTIRFSFIYNLIEKPWTSYCHGKSTCLNVRSWKTLIKIKKKPECKKRKKKTFPTYNWHLLSYNFTAYIFVFFKIICHILWFTPQNYIIFINS